MKMTRQHFQLIADVILNAPRWDDGSLEEKGLVEAFAIRLAKTNPLFNRDGFVDAATGGLTRDDDGN